MIETIQNEHWQLEVAPDVGASVVNLRGRVGDAFVPIMRQTSAETLALALQKSSSSGLSSFTLAPFSNRIREARFLFHGQQHRMRVTTPDGNTQHGDVRNRRWTVVRHDLETLEGWFDSRSAADFNFPFQITMNVVYELEGNTFETRLELRNVSKEPMPAGFGLHPYFVRTINGSRDVTMGFQVGGVYQTDNSYIPTQAMQAVPDALDFSRQREVGAQVLNHGFGAWDGRVALEYPRLNNGESAVRVVMDADDLFTHLVVYTAPDGTLAVEPVTNATDAFNLMAQGVPGTGTVILEPGAVMSGSVRLRLETT
jgi:aldose 1-epimerase